MEEIAARADGRHELLHALHAQEETIREGLKSFQKVWQAFLAIHEERLYEARSYSTFEEYCQTEWEISRAYGHRLVKAGRVMKVLSPIGDIPLPENEAQAREISRLPEDQWTTTWQEVMRDRSKAPTGAELREFVASKLDKPKTETPSLDFEGLRGAIKAAGACMQEIAEIVEGRGKSNSGLIRNLIQYFQTLTEEWERAAEPMAEAA